MPKISNLPIVLGVFLLLGGCGTLTRPEYKTQEYTAQSEFSTPQELYQSEDVIKDAPHPLKRGPFQLQWPVHQLKINRGFIKGGRKEHLGWDIKGRKGDRILAAHDGTVIYSGSGFRGYGKMIIVEYDETWATLYAHLSRSRVKTGQSVKAGEIIGEMGRTGRATGVHLHFELIKNKQPVDPSPWLSPSGMTNNG